MALLTAEDVLNKAFSKTKYREGFDQDEVDDFLDEVANAITALTSERDQLRAQLDQVTAGGAYVPPPSAAPATGGLAAVAPGAGGLLGAATDPSSTPASMLAMARALHDEYVQTGEQEKQRIVDEARAEAERIVARAGADANTRTQALTSEQAAIEGRIDDLRRFERDYRNRLRTYLENLLGDIDHGRGQDRSPDAASSI